MARLARGEVSDPHQVASFHVLNRTIRRQFLMGNDSRSGKNFDHRKVWIEELLEQFAGSFGIDLLGFAILSNHFHLVLRTRPDLVASWDDTEVATRWLRICPPRKRRRRSAAPRQADLDRIRNDPKRLAEIRIRLSNVSWWMRLLSQRVAQRANREDDQSGHFWQDRFRATRLIDEASLLACCAYVDLNPIRAAMTETIEASDYTSIQRRIQTKKAIEGSHPKTSVSPSARRDAFLAKLTISEASDPVGPVPSKTGLRCSDNGFLAMELSEYLSLLDWTARQPVEGKSGRTPEHLAPVLKRLGLTADPWQKLVREFGRLYGPVAGRCDEVDALRSHLTGRRFPLSREARELLPALN